MATKETPSHISMEDIMESSPEFVDITPGTVISGRVISTGSGKLLIDIGGVATGIISGRELNDTFGTAKNLQIGDEVGAFVLEDETDEGMIILSLRKAAQEKSWEYFEKIQDEGGTIEVVAKMANKGGLMVEVNGVTAFLPVSQLSPQNYPRVDGANAEAILAKLEALVGRKFTTKIILLDLEIRKLVVSERAATAELRENEMSKLKLNDEVEGEVNGIVKFGAFVLFGNLEGLVHISEMTWSHVKTPTELFKLGDKVKVKVIGVEGHKISLSIKQLEPDPWLDKIESYEIGSSHKGSINKVTNYGIFVTLEDGVNGLVHTSEFENESIDPEKEYKEGQEVEVKVLEILMDDHSLRLSLKGTTEKESSSEKTSASVSVKTSADKSADKKKKPVSKKEKAEESVDKAQDKKEESSEEEISKKTEAKEDSPKEKKSKTKVATKKTAVKKKPKKADSETKKKTEKKTTKKTTKKTADTKKKAAPKKSEKKKKK